MQLVLLVVALVLLILAAIGVPSNRFSLGFAGLAFWLFATEILGRVN